MTYLIICDLPIEESIVRQDENLLDVFSFVFITIQTNVIAADAKHLLHQGTHDKERTGLHAGYDHQ